MEKTETIIVSHIRSSRNRADHTFVSNEARDSLRQENVNKKERD